ncbi:hypothetical protein D3C72_1455690 [compost metagenome]
MLSLGMANATLSRSRTSLRAGCVLAVLALLGCADEGDHGLPGHWFPTEINGQDITGSSVELWLDDIETTDLMPTTYELSLGCADAGRWDSKQELLVSNATYAGGAPQDQCQAADAPRLDALRRMTHEGVTIGVDAETYEVSFSTASGQSARFTYFPSPVVD